MPIKNPKALLIEAIKLPAAIEAKLPEGAPKISTMLTDAAGKLPVELPDFPMELPDLPAPPELPEIPGAPALARPFVGPGVIVTPRPAAVVPVKPLGEEILS